ncbi:DUF3726 domain-containing protein [Pseudooctadecabacter sp.]|uniref:DUF3726 domain-containing protein n=1 Tax=Pseudooctadecabacter sp. TaxID=1966338 RepID=UPI0035C829DA
MEMSANEVEMLVLKAARGGGCPVGLAEDLAAAVAYVDLNALQVCPCDSGAVRAIPAALDAVVADGQAQTVVAELALVQGYVAALAGQVGLTVEGAETGQVTVQPMSGTGDAPSALGRRILRADLLAHLQDMAARTLVPETESSRAAGAGAGLTDND